MAVNLADVTLISGASRGLGLDYTRELSKRGVSVLALVRSQQEDAWDDTLGTAPPLFFEADLQDSELAPKLESFLDQESIHISRILHAAGGGLGLRAPLLRRHEFMRLVDANWLGAAEINRVLIPRMIDRGFGRVIHVGSTAATQALGSVGYNSVKAALDAYVRSLGNELIRDNVVVAGINPGAFVGTDNAMVRLRSRNPEAYEDFITNRLPRQQMADSSDLFEVLNLLLFGSSSMLAGSMIAVDGGESKAYL